MMSQDEIIETMERFRNLINEADSIVKQCEMDINEADKAFGDIRHYCELNSGIESTKKTKICKLIRDYSARRRRAKDTLAVIGGLAELLKKDNSMKYNVCKVVNDAKKSWRFISGERRYTPRVLDELFEDNK